MSAQDQGGPDQDGQDHADESGPITPDRLFITQEELRPAAVSEPLAIEGVIPDLEDIPGMWLQETPAQEVSSLDGVTAGLPQSDPTLTANVPAPPQKALPSVLDAAPGWQATYSCDPNNRPGMVAFAELVSQHYDRSRYYASRKCLKGDNSQHYEGRAMDWPMDVNDPDDKAIGDAVATWLTRNDGEMARRFGVMSVIWNERSWYISVPGRWWDYNGPSPHTDHLHISFTWDGAMKRTSWWTGQPVTQVDYGTCRVYSLQYAPRYQGRRTSPCPTSLPSAPSTSFPVILPTARTSDVGTAQAHLGLRGLNVDRSFGPTTLQLLLAYQRNNRLPVTGVLDNATWHHFFNRVHRVAGADRYATASALSSFSRVGREVYVTTGENYPDALAASARAGMRGSPVLLVHDDGIPATTVAELRRIKPWRIIVLGGTSAVKSSVLTSLRSYTPGYVARIAGEDRYGTAGELALQFGTNVSVAYVATGQNYPDALVGAARAAYNDGPMLLTKRGSIPPETVSALRAINPGRIVVVGNTNQVSSSVLTALRKYSASGEVQRVGGDTFYATAANLASYYPTGLNVVYVATGRTYPDALAAASRAGTTAGPVLLTSPTVLPWATQQALSSLKPKRIVVVGGTEAVSAEVYRQIRAYGP